MNKNDLIASVADSAGLSKADATKAVDAVARRAATEGRNPRTGEKIKIPASKQPKFKAGKALKDAVN